MRVTFLFVCYFTGHHQVWLSSITTNRHGVAAFDFATVYGCGKLVVDPTQLRTPTLRPVGSLVSETGMFF